MGLQKADSRSPITAMTGFMNCLSWVTLTIVAYGGRKEITQKKMKKVFLTPAWATKGSIFMFIPVTDISFSITE